MKIVVTGAAGSGKTTARLLLQGMMPQYTFYTRNVEGEATIGGPSFSDSLIVPDPTLDLALQLTGDVVFVIAQYSAIPREVRELIAPNLTILLSLDLQARIERIQARNPAVPIEQICQHINNEPAYVDLPVDITIDTSGPRENIEQAMIAIVDRFSLRPQTWTGTL